MIRPDQGARCAEATGIQELAGVGGGLLRLSRNEATSPKRCFTRALADALPI